MLRTLFKRKCGKSDLRARLDDVKWENNFAYNSLCLYVRSATASKKNRQHDNINRSNIEISTTVRSLKREENSV